MTRAANDAEDPLLLVTTRDSDEPADAAHLEAVPTLTILSHPDAGRIGQVARLAGLAAGRFVALSRAELRFGWPSGEPEAPLSDPFLSRKPMSFGTLGDRCVLVVDPGGSSLTADGVPVRGTHELPADALVDGVVLELGDRVVLLLHLALPRAVPRSPSLGLVGDSDAMERVRRDILRVADLDVSLLIRGETGTGKELVAGAIHATSRRSSRKCVCVNMADLSESVAASELFGHVRGAFTGAVHDALGYFASADGGTLFLDEIGDTPAAVQPMLLRAIETGEVQRVGATSARRVDVRLIAATDADLEADVRSGRFGGPLLHRLANFEITLPPLRARRDDVGRLFIHFLRAELASIGESHRLDGATDARLYVPPSLVARLARYDWPGNVRQLWNVVRQLVISSRGEDRLHVGPSVERLLASSTKVTSAATKRKPSEITDGDLVAALRANGWRREATARQLGIAVSSLYGLIDRCVLLRKASEIPRDELERCRADCENDLARMSEQLEVSTRGLQLRMRELGMV